jgi:hypothetical protein
MLNLQHKKCKLGGVHTWSNAKKCKRNLWRLPKYVFYLIESSTFIQNNQHFKVLHYNFQDLSGCTIFSSSMLLVQTIKKLSKWWNLDLHKYLRFLKIFNLHLLIQAVILFLRFYFWFFFEKIILTIRLVHFFKIYAFYMIYWWELN